MYEHSANAYGEVTLAMKLDVPGEASNERYANTRIEATLAAKLNAYGKAGIWTPLLRTRWSNTWESLDVKRWDRNPEDLSSRTRGKAGC